MQAKGMLGREMVYDLTEIVREFLLRHNHKTLSFYDEMMLHKKVLHSALCVALLVFSICSSSRDLTSSLTRWCLAHLAGGGTRSAGEGAKANGGRNQRAEEEGGPSGAKDQVGALHYILATARRQLKAIASLSGRSSSERRRLFAGSRRRTATGWCPWTTICRTMMIMETTRYVHDRSLLETTTGTIAYAGEGSPTQEASDNSFVPAKGKEKGVSVAIKANALAKGLHDRKEEVVKKGTSPFVSPSVRHHRMLVVQVTNCLCRRQPADTVEAQKQPRQGYLWRGDSGHESRYKEADGGKGGQLRKRARHQQKGQSNTHSFYTPSLNC